MAHRKAGGSAKNLSDSNPKYLGVKRADGQAVQTGEVIIRQRGTKFRAGINVGIGKDHTLFAKADGIVKFSTVKHRRFDNKTMERKLVSVVSA
jgi:large subunit ribosomal protein L27